MVVRKSTLRLPHVRHFSIWKTALPILVLVLAYGCQRVDLDSLPPIPLVDTKGFVPAAKAQLDSSLSSLRAEPGNVDLNGRIGMMLQTYKQYQASAVMYQRARLLDPKDFKWVYLHGVVLDAVGKHVEAVEAFRKVLSINDFSHAKIRLAKLLADEGNVAEAEALYAQLMQVDEPVSEAWFNYGQFLVEQGRAEEGIKAIESAMKISGDFKAAHYQLGIAYRDSGDATRAAEHFRLAQVHTQRLAASSDPILAELLHLNQNPQPFVSQAKRLAESGQLEQARQFIDMALERDPQNAAAHTSSLGLAVRTGKLDSVDEHFEKAIKSDPNNAKAYFNLGLARVEQGRLNDAREALERSVELDNQDPNAHVQLAKLAKLLKEGSPQIEERLQAALAIDPGHQEAHWLLGELMVDEGRYAEAEDHLSQAVSKQHPMRPMMFVALARLRARQSDWPAAFAALDDGMEDAKILGDSEMTQRIAKVTAAMRAIHQKISN